MSLVPTPRLFISLQSSQFSYPYLFCPNNMHQKIKYYCLYHERESIPLGVRNWLLWIPIIQLLLTLHISTGSYLSWVVINRRWCYNCYEIHAHYKILITKLVSLSSYFIYLYMIFLQHSFYSEQHCFTSRKDSFQCSANISNLLSRVLNSI